jgi:hypothetical protein
LQEDYYLRLRGDSLMRVPDFLVHASNEKAFYEVKPDSVAGMRAGVQKVGILGAVYRHYHLPYRGGTAFTPRDHTLATLGSALKATLRVRRAAPGLIVYKICLSSKGAIELATLAALLRYIVKQVNSQKGTGRFRPIDLESALRNQQLPDVARLLGLSMAAGATATLVKVGWRHFWKAVVKRFAVRGATAALLAGADGPLPVGDLIAAGMAIWTVVDVIRLSDQLWRDADSIARQGA